MWREEAVGNDGGICSSCTSRQQRIPLAKASGGHPRIEAAEIARGVKRHVVLTTGTYYTKLNRGGSAGTAEHTWRSYELNAYRKAVRQTCTNPVALEASHGLANDATIIIKQAYRYVFQSFFLPFGQTGAIDIGERPATDATRATTDRRTAGTRQSCRAGKFLGTTRCNQSDKCLLGTGIRIDDKLHILRHTRNGRINQFGLIAK